MKKMTTLFVFVFAMINLSAEDFGFDESYKQLAGWRAANLLKADQFSAAAACTQMIKDIEQADLAREQKKLFKLQQELLKEQIKLYKTQQELLNSQVREVIKSIRYLVDETYKRKINGWMR